MPFPLRLPPAFNYAQLRQFLTVAQLSLWLAGRDSYIESARSDSRFRRDWFVGSRPLWTLLVAHLFIWDDKYFDQPLSQLAIDWESSSAQSQFFSNARWINEVTLLSNTAVRQNRTISGCQKPPENVLQKPSITADSLRKNQPGNGKLRAQFPSLLVGASLK